MWWAKTVLLDLISPKEKKLERKIEAPRTAEKIKVIMPRLLIAVLWLLMLSACGSDKIADYKTIDNGLWSYDEAIQFALPQLDSLRRYDLLLSLRNTNDYPYNNLFLLVTMTHPDGYAEVDTLEYRMAAPDGTWLGVGAGNIKDNLLAYKESMTFDKAGQYGLSIRHAVRNNSEVQGVSQLQGIVELGYQLSPLE
ncbi:MAG TPA: gliding motility lipoprotein GldH [Flavobacteriaceae bacterium]|nr:gliding motility lipoprotein GldH [Flavobacteriaceae bacterium]